MYFKVTSSFIFYPITLTENPISSIISFESKFTSEVLMEESKARSRKATKYVIWGILAIIMSCLLIAVVVASTWFGVAGIVKVTADGGLPTLIATVVTFLLTRMVLIGFVGLLQALVGLGLIAVVIHFLVKLYKAYNESDQTPPSD
jgi:hypothetical protein